MSEVIMYGIKNCDTIKKAKKWLEEHQVNFEFHDYRQQGIERSWLTQAVANLGWEAVLNKRGTTYRQLAQEQKDAMNESLAIDVMLEQPAMIKRPILSVDGQLHLGFKADQFAAIFN